MRRLALLLLPAALIACDPISEEECRGGDWTEIGIRDGAQGLPQSRFSDYVEICRGFGIAPRRSAYEAGRQKGLEQYCTPASAYRVGRRGRDIAPVCSPERLQSMAPAHRAGMIHHDLSEEIAELEQEISEARRRLARDFAGELGEEELRLARLLSERIDDLQDDRDRLRRERRRYQSWPL